MELGINFFDTANSYSDGTSEEILGQALRDFARRDQVVIATKVYHRTRQGPNGRGLSRKAIFTEVEASLRRLGTDYIDLYQIHRWDYGTPVEETLEALHDVVKAGRLGTPGRPPCSPGGSARRFAWPGCGVATRLVSMQDHYNLLYREEEREMVQLCQAEGIGSCLGAAGSAGRLAKAVGGSMELGTARRRGRSCGKTLYTVSEDADAKWLNRGNRSSTRHPRGAGLAVLASLWTSPFRFTAPIVGGGRSRTTWRMPSLRSPSNSREEIASLEGAYAPHAVMGLLTQKGVTRIRTCISAHPL